MATLTAPSDYSHGYHAGNVGDVWKHCALVAWLEAAKRQPGPLLYLETHAGEGRYKLSPTGEWTEGIGRLLGPAPPGGWPAAVGRYLGLARRAGLRIDPPHGGSYPGSPLLGLALLGEEDRALFHELAGGAQHALEQVLAGDSRASVVRGDGLAALGGALEGEERPMVLIDPPYTDRAEWIAVPDAVVRAHRARPDARLMLWYPVKSLTRPEAMLKRLRLAGVPATALELITTPLELKRNRLNGSGVLLVNPPAGALLEIAAAAPALGARCATHEGRWFTRGVSWEGAGGAPIEEPLAALR